MRTFLIFSFLLCFGAMNAQDQLLFIHETFPTQVEKQQKFLKEHIPELNNPNINLSVRFANESPLSRHYTFDILYKDLPIFSQYIKVNTNKKNKIISIANGAKNLEQLRPIDIALGMADWQGKKPNFTTWSKEETVKKHFLAIHQKDDQSEIVQVQQAWDKTYDKTKLINQAGQIVTEWNHVLNLGIDTFVNANVFSPDPLTFLNKMYGFPYVDSNDIDQAWMTPAYLPVNIPAIYDTFVNKFFLENDYVKIEDFEAPFIPVSSSVNNNFYFNRSESGFEECMVAYHITAFHDYMSSLGYDTLMDLQLSADAHGQFGADNSIFNRNGSSPNIIFGDGGIDDAEDADVIIHEYSHGVSWSANANAFFSNERRGLDEGLADYFATSYSRHIDPYNWQKVFSWDGNNGQWQGRIANTSMTYLQPFPGNFYELGEVWNAAMQNIFTDLGRNTTDALMLETLFFLTDNTTLTEAARYMLQADTLLNNGANVNVLCQHFRDKSILSSSCLAVGLADRSAALKGLEIFNSHNFSLGLGNLTIQLPESQNARLELFSLNGQKILQRPFTQGRVTLSPQDVRSGLCIAKVISKKGVHTLKLSRQ
jgi:hypothetical protein